MIPLDAEPDPALEAEARALMASGLGKAEVEFASSITGAIFWVLRNDGIDRIKNGSMFFLDTGESMFGVTASHVVDECLADSRLPTFVQCMIGSYRGHSLSIHLGDRIIDAHPDIDIATLRFTRDEVAQIGRTVLTGYQKAWPPPLPWTQRGVIYSGFPGIGRRVVAPRSISFGMVTAGGLATSVSDISISVQIEREHLIDVIGEGNLPENFDFGGISGGPLLTIVQTPTLRSWMPGGVIVQGPNPSTDASEAIEGFEVIKARPMKYIMPNGKIDSLLWEQNNIR
jgi:hypothetical protein